MDNEVLREPRLYAGSETGYVDAGVSRLVNPYWNEHSGFSDLDGDGYEDVLLFESIEAGSDYSVSVLFGAKNLSDVQVREYDLTDHSSFFHDYELGDVDGDGQGEIVRMTGSEAEMVLDLYTIDQNRLLSTAQSATVGEWESNAYELELFLINVDANEGPEIVTRPRFGDVITTRVFTKSGSLQYNTTPQDLHVGNDATPIGDLDGDGRHDFLLRKGAYGEAYVAFGPADIADGLTFDARFDAGGRRFTDAPFTQAGDYNGDGRDDVILEHRTYNTRPFQGGRQYVSSDASRTVSSETVTTTLRHYRDDLEGTVTVGDVDGDGATDAAVLFEDRGTVGVYTGLGGSPSSTPDVTLDVQPFPVDAVGGDFNGDGEQDLAVASRGTTADDSEIAIFFGGSGLSGPPDHTIAFTDLVPSGYDDGFDRITNAGDLNDDGHDDLVASAPFSDDLGTYLNQAFVFYGGTPLPTTADAVLDYSDESTSILYVGEGMTGVGDFNGDGVDDFAIGINGLATSEPGSRGVLEVYFGAAESPTFAEPDLRMEKTETDYWSFHVVGGSDVNGDGVPDLVAAPNAAYDEKAHAGYVYYGGTGAGYGDATVDDVIDIPKSITGSNEQGTIELLLGTFELTDFDRDGRADIVYATGYNTNAFRFPGKSTPANTVAEVREPTGVFEAPVLFRGLGGNQRVAVGDVTGDGSPDLFVRQNDDNEAAMSGRLHLYQPFDASVEARVSRSFGDASGPGDYRLVALPGDATTPLAQTLDGEAGVAWQAYREDGSQIVRFDDTDAFTFQPGNGFWLTSTQSWSVQRTAAPMPLTSNATTVDLHDGWNILSNPLASSVQWSAVAKENGRDLPPLWSFNGAFERADVFRSAGSGQAYYFLNDAGLDSLTIPYSEAPRKAQPRSASGAEAEAAPFLALSAGPTSGSAPASTVRVRSAQTTRRTPAVAPPGRFEAVSLRALSTSSPDDRLGQRLAVQYDPDADGQTFDLRLSDRTRGPVRLSVRTGDAFDGASAALLHPAAQTSYALRDGRTVTLRPETQGTDLTLVVGSAAFVTAQRQAIAPTQLSLTAYPNPARQEATSRAPGGDLRVRPARRPVRAARGLRRARPARRDPRRRTPRGRSAPRGAGRGRAVERALLRTPRRRRPAPHAKNYGRAVTPERRDGAYRRPISGARVESLPRLEIFRKRIHGAIVLGIVYIVRPSAPRWMFAGTRAETRQASFE